MIARIAGLLVAATLLAGPAFAQGTPSPADRMKSCNADAKAQGLKGAGRKAFLSTCLKGDSAAAPGAATAPAAPTTTVAAPPATAPSPRSGAAASRTPTPAQTAERERIKQCGAEWKADKAAGKVAAGQTWPKYWSACNTRLKGG